MTTHAATMLAKIETFLEGTDLSAAEYEIAGRRLKHYPLADLITLRNNYRAEVRRETAATSIAAGTGDPRRVFVRFAGRA